MTPLLALFLLAMALVLVGAHLSINRDVRNAIRADRRDDVIDALNAVAGIPPNPFRRVSPFHRRRPRT